MNPYINYLAAAIIALVSGTGGWATLQLVINRRGRKAEAGRLEAETEAKKKEAAKTEAERLALLSEVERKAYAAAEMSADKRYSTLERDYDRCTVALNELRNVIEPVLDAIDVIMAGIQPSIGDDVTITVTKADIITVRGSLRTARRHLN
jgi:hypothetical protein